MRYQVDVPVQASRLATIDILAAKGSLSQRTLVRKGLAGYQPNTTAGLLAAWELAPRPLVFFDVGANGGMYSWMCKTTHPDSTVVAFEPTSTPAAAARRIAEANGLDICVVQAAVSDRQGTARLYISDRSDASNSLTAGFRQATGTIEVDTLTLDQYAAEQGIAPTVLKIDVEKHEPEVLDGAKQLLADVRPIVVIEVLDGSPVLQTITSAGYEVAQLGIGHDWVCWPERVPDGWDAAVSRWAHVVSRCGPARPVS